MTGRAGYIDLHQILFKSNSNQLFLYVPCALQLQDGMIKHYDSIDKNILS